MADAVHSLGARRCESNKISRSDVAKLGTGVKFFFLHPSTLGRFQMDSFGKACVDIATGKQDEAD